MYENDCVVLNDFFFWKFDIYYLIIILFVGVLNDIYMWVSVIL